MKKILGLITIYILMLACNVYANDNNSGNEEGNSEYVQPDNGGSDSNNNSSPSSVNNSGNSSSVASGGTATGGQGGNGFGGKGGAAYSGAVGIGAALSGANSYSGANVAGANTNTSGASSASVGRIINQGSTYNQVQQVPFAYAPSTNVGSGKYRCNDGASLGVSSGFGAISGGLPVTDDLCQQLVMADWLADHNLMQEACEMMLMDERVAEVFKKTGRTCKPVIVQPTRVVRQFMDPNLDFKLESIFNNR
jgi:hypothetical protein